MTAFRLVLTALLAFTLTACGTEQENSDGCSTDSDCAAGFVCDQSTGTCVESSQDVDVSDMDDASQTDLEDTTASDTTDLDAEPGDADAQPDGLDADTPEPDMVDIGIDIADGVDIADGTDVDPDVPPVMWPASPTDYANTVGPHVTWVSEYTIPPAMGGPDNGPTCCRDWGSISKDNIRSGTNRIDNAFAALSASVGALAPGVDFNTTLNELAAGEFTVLLEHRRFNGTPTDQNFELVRLNAEFAPGTTESQARLGNGSFVIDPASFLPGTGEPRLFFEKATMSGGALDAGPDGYELVWPLLEGVFIAVPLLDTRVVGMATISSGGVTYQQGELTGYIRYEDLLVALNDFAASPRCNCLGLSGDLYQLSGGQVIADQCLDAATAQAQCSKAAEEACVQIAAGFSGIDVCGLMPSLIAGITDLDTDGNCASDPDNCDYEAMSVGLEWTGVPAQVSGLAP